MFSPAVRGEHARGGGGCPRPSRAAPLCALVSAQRCGLAYLASFRGRTHPFPPHVYTRTSSPLLSCPLLSRPVLSCPLLPMISACMNLCCSAIRRLDFVFNFLTLYILPGESSGGGGGANGAALRSGGAPAGGVKGEVGGGVRSTAAGGAGGGGSGGALRSKMLQVSRGHICDLLSFCVRSHTFRMKYFVLRNNVVRDE